MSQRFPFSSFPNGWFRVAFSDELPLGGVKPLHYFGKDLVLFRTEDGTPHVFNAHCPHLGAHLGYGGKVEGNSIRCPFHGWCFDHQGHCIQIPYSNKVPPKTQMQSLPVCEYNGLIMVYYHTQGKEPTWQMPELPKWNSQDWTSFQRRSWKIRTHAQDMSENVVDTAHMLWLHGQSFRGITEAEFDIKEEVFVQRLHPKYRLSIAGNLGWDTQSFVEIGCYGLGCQVSYTHVKAFIEFHSLAMFMLTPIDEEFLDVHVLVSTKNVLNKIITLALRSKSMKEISHNLKQDIPIWENKLYRSQPILSSSDGPIIQYRRWTQQFFSDVSWREDDQVQSGNTHP